MKKLLLALLCGGLIFTGCTVYSSTEEVSKEPSYMLYFQERDLKSAAGAGALRAESAQLPEGEEMDTLQVAEELMNDLLDGPRDETLKSAIPAGTTLLSLERQGTRIAVDLSAHYGTLSGVELTLADQAIALTLTQLPDVLAVKITVRGRELGYRDKQVFSGWDVLLAPEGDVVSTVDVVLYFLNEEAQLTPEERTLELYEGDTQVGAVIRAIENGPVSKGLSTALPGNFRVRSVRQEEDVCYANLSSGLLEEIPEDAQMQIALDALAKSLCSLKTVDEVRFLVDGEFANVYGTVDVSHPYMEE